MRAGLQRPICQVTSSLSKESAEGLVVLLQPSALRAAGQAQIISTDGSRELQPSGTVLMKPCTFHKSKHNRAPLVPGREREIPDYTKQKWGSYLCFQEHNNSQKWKKKWNIYKRHSNPTLICALIEQGTVIFPRSWQGMICSAEPRNLEGRWWNLPYNSISLRH